MGRLYMYEWCTHKLDFFFPVYNAHDAWIGFSNFVPFSVCSLLFSLKQFSGCDNWGKPNKDRDFIC